MSQPRQTMSRICYPKDEKMGWISGGGLSRWREEYAQIQNGSRAALGG